MGDVRRTPWWVWVACLGPLGLGVWATLIPAVERRRASWLVLSLVTTALVATGILLADGDDESSLAGGLIILGWMGAVALSLSIRGPYLRGRQPSAWEQGREQAEVRLRERREALALVAGDPALAMELGVGRPDVPGARHAGLVDVNHADATAISGLPGFDADLARRVVAMREDVNGFQSLADFGAVADLDGNQVERLRERAVFLPR